MCEANTVKLLTKVMTQAVPEVCVTGVKVSCWVVDGVETYFLTVYPDHVKYWSHFHKRYPWCEQVALRYGAEEQASCAQLCLMFSTRKELLDWLFDTIGLSQGERNLLHLYLMK